MVIKVKIIVSHRFVTFNTAVKELKVRDITLRHRIDRDELDVCYPFPEIEGGVRCKFPDSMRSTRGKPKMFIIKNEKYQKYLDLVGMKMEYLKCVGKTEEELNHLSSSNSDSPSEKSSSSSMD